eukprot:3170341-Ditylum_brightwellii.AAC.1
MHNLQLSIWGGGRVHTCRFLEPSLVFLGRSGGLGHKGYFMPVLGRISIVPADSCERGSTQCNWG